MISYYHDSGYVDWWLKTRDTVLDLEALDAAILYSTFKINDARLEELQTSNGLGSFNESIHCYQTKELSYSAELPDHNACIGMMDGRKAVEVTGNTGDSIVLSLEDDTPSVLVTPNDESAVTVSFYHADEAEQLNEVEIQCASENVISASESGEGILVHTDSDITVSASIDGERVTKTFETEENSALIIAGDNIDVYTDPDGDGVYNVNIPETAESAATPTPSPTPAVTPTPAPGVETVKLSRPAAPKAVNTSKGIKLTWRSVPDARKYRVFRKAGGEVFKLGDTTKLTYTDKEAANGKKVSYYILAVGYRTPSVIYKTSAKSKVRTIIRLAAPSSLKVTSKKAKTATIQWKKNAGATGYQIRYSRKKTMAGAKTVTIKKNIAKKTLAKLASKKIYWFRIRAYKKAGSKYTYSTWSAKKKVRVK